MKGKIGLSLFGLPFFAVGLWMSWSISAAFLDYWQMQDWQSADAQLHTAGYRTHQGDDSRSYEAYATYSYTINGQSYNGSRVAISGGADNIGDYQTDTGNRLATTLAQGAPITVYVNPGNHSEAIIDRELRWGLLGFKSIFLFVFGGVGLGLLIYARRSRSSADTDALAESGTPWLQNNAWQTAEIRSGSKATMWVAVGFALFWNLISAPLPFLVYDEILNNGNPAAWLGILFPLIGIGLLVFAGKRVAEWRRFGAAPLVLDPFPGSIGGHVGGTIDLKLPFNPDTTFELTLTCIESYISGSGKNRSRREKAEWQDSALAHSEPGGRGTRVVFRFDVPADLDPADARRNNDRYRLWRININAELPGADFDRDYDIPVYPTATRSRHLPAMAIQSTQSLKASRAEQRIRELFRFDQYAAGKRLYFPMGQKLAGPLGGIFFGAIFIASGWFLAYRGDSPLFGLVFGLVGGLIALAAIYLLFRSLEVIQDGSALVSVRRVCGIPVSRRRLEKHSIDRLHKHSSMQSQSGGKHVVYYSVYALDYAGEKLLLGEGFKGQSEATAAMDFISREFQLPAKHRATADTNSPSTDDSNLLTDNY
ncbi:DUF3592 domain-containing protein [Woeseia oceani]|nr:DUF3592 domain-containing protein [Woeseia oceani]